MDQRFKVVTMVTVNFLFYVNMSCKTVEYF